MKNLFALILLLSLYGCGKKSQVMSAEFSSMDNCLSAIQRNSDKELEIVTDKLGDISGFLKDTKLGFQCKTEVTGTKGVVVNGWYQTDE
ncbi:hypothetical protein [Acinetobacter bereziniae]|uniref:hypothetical protein n=1 Tax=Acinetobacter bereziniae TaxID=106648 RepID=UPI0021E4E98C|nr:hypothetical protein [Acinetobacter bereziniae]MCV2445588.1 hypothetical protein [Acinetobacter bereziniae]